MIVSFYDKNFKGLQNNASLVIDKQSYELIKRPIEFNSLSCKCEAFTEDIQPTFLLIKDDRGGYVYGSLAGIPVLNEKNITEITGTDLKSMLSSDVVLEPSIYSKVNSYIDYIFSEWNNQVNQDSIACELVYKDYVGDITIGDYQPSTEKAVYNAWDEIKSYLKFYNLYMDTYIDLVNKKVKFIIGKTLYRNLNIKLWEYGIKNYGKWVASINEAQGYYVEREYGTWTPGYKWILTSQNQITTAEANRDIFPIKKKIIVNEEGFFEANSEALTELLESMYNENITINTQDISADFETKFSVYTKQGAPKYKELPCGELHYKASGLVKCQIGYRYVGAEFI